jgi:nucleoside-diphosphate-sugar epimerase
MVSVVVDARRAIAFHLDANTHARRSQVEVDEYIQTNLQGTVALLQALARSDYRRFVYTTTSEVYRDIAIPFRKGAAADPLPAMRSVVVRLQSSVGLRASWKVAERLELTIARYRRVLERSRSQSPS